MPTEQAQTTLPPRLEKVLHLEKALRLEKGLHLEKALRLEKVKHLLKAQPPENRAIPSNAWW